MALTLSTLGIAGLLGLTACGPGGAGVAAPLAAVADLSDEATALQAVGFETGLEAATPAPSASTGKAAKKGDRRHAVRKFLRKNTLHGEVTVQGKDGTRTVVVQRGTVTAVTSGGVSVKSTDGFALTWTFGDELRVVQDKKSVPTSTLKVGGEIGVAGAKDGEATAARLIAVR
jgi:hypothetical protein